MTATPEVPAPLQAADAAFDETGVKRELTGAAWKVVAGVALAFSTYQLVIAAFSPLSSLVTRSLHVGFLLLLAFLIHPVSASAPTGTGSRGTTRCWRRSRFALALYHWVFEADLIQRSGDPTVADLVVGTRRRSCCCSRRRGACWASRCRSSARAFLAYGLFGQYLPSAIAHRGYGFDQIVGQLYLGTEGIYGIPTLVSATYIFLFILFGSFLEHAGMISLFNNIALGFVGHARGGPAKVAVISSGMMGTISGSGVANVLTVGQFTIPLMKRFGYSPVFAGAVEATSSMGGQIMPPVMGAVAFIMAETLNVPYVTIVKAAVIPAILYYADRVLDGASRSRPRGPASACPRPNARIRGRRSAEVVPDAAARGARVHAVRRLHADVLRHRRARADRRADPRRRASPPASARCRSASCSGSSLGLGTASFFKYGIWPIIAMIAALVAVNFVIKGGRETLAIMRGSLIDGAKQAVAVGIACAIVGVIIGVLTLTGAASNFAGFVLDVGAKSLFLSLLLTMVVCLVLGMGIPTIPNYIITSAIAAPALLKLGVPLIVSHMFVFYFGIMADLTPPVALAAFAAASIAKASPMKIGWKATHIAIAGFVIPYMAVYDPALMLQGGTLLDTAYVVVQGDRRDRSVGRRRDRLPARTAQLAGAHRRDRRGVPARRRRAADRRGRLRASAAFVAWHWYRTRAAAPRGAAELASPRTARRWTPICLLVAGVVRATLPGPEFTLAWDALGREDALGGALPRSTATRCVLVEARVAGQRRRAWSRRPARSLRDGDWTWQPQYAACRAAADALDVHARLHAVLRRDGCASLAALVGADRRWRASSSVACR